MSDGVSVIDKIHQEIDIVSLIGEFVPLSKKGRSFVGLCPFHEDKNPSMSVSPQKQVYNCFVCGNKGDAITFLAEFKKISRAKAIQELASRLGINIADTTMQPRYSEKQLQLISALKVADQFYQNQLDRHPNSVGAKYAASRGLELAVREKFRIGLALSGNELATFLKARDLDEAVLMNASLVNARGQDFFTNRLTFAITNEFNDVIGFSARTLDNHEAKYINSSDSLVFHKQEIFYNLYNAKDAIVRNKKIYICEGQMDVIALDRAGFSNAVAVMGTALTPEHLKHLPQKTKVVLNFDSDKAGIIATLRSLPLLLKARIETAIIATENTKDADQILATEGVDGIKRLLNNEISPSAFAIKHCKQGLDLSSSTGIKTYLETLKPILNWVGEIEQSMALQQLSTDLKLDLPLLTRTIGLSKNYEKSSGESSRPALEATDAPIEINFYSRYTYALLRTLLNKPNLIYYFVEHKDQTFIAERQLEALINYTVKRSKDSAANSAEHEKALQIAMQKATFEAHNEAELTNLLSRVNEEFYDYHIYLQKKLLKKGVSDSEAELILTTISKYKQKKRAISHDQEND